MKLIGLSLSFCISDIISGKVAEDDVVKIVTNTRMGDENSKLLVVGEYCESYWRKAPEQAREVFERLWQAGKIEQPRLVNPDGGHNTACGHWLDADQPYTLIPPQQDGPEWCSARYEGTYVRV